MFWLWVVVIVEGAIIVGLAKWIAEMDHAAHHRLRILEDRVDQLQFDTRTGAFKP